MVWLWRLRRSSGGSGDGIASRAVARIYRQRVTITCRTQVHQHTKRLLATCARYDPSFNRSIAKSSGTDCSRTFVCATKRPKFMEILDKLDPRQLWNRKRARR